MSTTLEDRVILVLREQAGDYGADGCEAMGSVAIPAIAGGYGFWERLAERTGVLSRRWRKVYARQQKMTSDMFEALARLFPLYAFWLATGVTDAVNGHVAPLTAQTFPERLHTDSMESTAYFRASIELADRLFREGRVNMENESERLYAAERTRPLAHWHDSPLADAAYRLAGTQEYANLQDLWRRRETERLARCRSIAGEAHGGEGARDEAAMAASRTPVLGVDARTVHQDVWDLFYVPVGRKTDGRR
ncbi:hypothetical protein [Paraburkholderia tropica]|uniref:hypothetical protein n=1 Tax=Paraburkholderia tropica TaxID=92647 RepID=UPI002AB620C7|nr:hypothetical protein [Paraburkholderia tropica]